MNHDLRPLPEWAFKTFFVLGCIGAGAVLFGFCLAVAWVIRHLAWVP